MNLSNTVTIKVSRIEYDTINNGVDQRPWINKASIPKSRTIVMHVAHPDFDPNQIASAILAQIETDWLVDGFDWRIVAPVQGNRYRVDCRVRMAKGVSIFDTPAWRNSAGHPFTCNRV